MTPDGQCLVFYLGDTWVEECGQVKRMREIVMYDLALLLCILIT